MFAQTPYTIPPKWHFGWSAGFDFTSGSPTTSNLPGSTTNITTSPGLESSASICDINGDVVFYTDAVKIFNGYTHAVIRDMDLLDNVSANSSTQANIAMPDPSDPYNKFYLFIANDITGGALSAGQGINYYKLTKSGTTVTVTSGPTNLIGNVVDESITISSDTSGGYWLISHGGTGGATVADRSSFYIWHITASGISALSKQVAEPTTNMANGGDNGSVKVNKCQDRIAWTGGDGHLYVWAWDNAQGIVRNPTSPLLHKGGANRIWADIAGQWGKAYGLEFSPDGNIIYTSRLFGFGWPATTALLQVDISTGTSTVLSRVNSNDPGLYAGAFLLEIGNLQIGPDDKIYVTNVGNEINAPWTDYIYVGVINTPNTSGAGCNYVNNQVTLNPSLTARPSYFRGLANQPWIGPYTQGALQVTAGSSCTQKNLTVTLKTYYGTTIAIDASTLQFDYKNTGTWVNGTNPQAYDYVTDGTYTTVVRFKDATICSNYYYDTARVVISCPMPVELLDLSVVGKGYNTSKVEFVTYNESDLKEYIVEYSLNGTDFKYLTSFVPNNIAGVSTYIFAHEDIKANLVYYRVKVINQLDRFSYSSIVPYSSNVISTEVYPNPTTSNFTLTIDVEDTYEIELTDALGKVVAKYNFNGNTHTFGGDLNKGMYYLTITGTGGFTKNMKIIKE